MYTVVIHRRAARYLKKLPQDQQTKVRLVLGQIRNYPFGLPGIKAMIGDWRVIVEYGLAILGLFSGSMKTKASST